MIARIIRATLRFITLLLKESVRKKHAPCAGQFPLKTRTRDFLDARQTDSLSMAAKRTEADRNPSDDSIYLGGLYYPNRRALSRENSISINSLVIPEREGNALSCSLIRGDVSFLGPLSV